MLQTTSMHPTAASAAHRLRSTMSGSVLVPTDAPYESARQLWNGAVDRRPALIARCRNATDVQAAVVAAREHNLTLSVRGGGHDWEGRSLRDGGLVVDLTAMRRVTVDVETRTAVVEGGATAGDLVAAARSSGLAPVTGTVKAVGMAGLTLAGGYGPLNGKYGLALDNLLGAEVVLANGLRIRADANENGDLYWALRGGGGNFGVVTSLRYRLHPIGSVLCGLMLFPASEALRVLRGYQELIAAAPDELTIMTGFLPGPDRQPMLFVFPTWSGDRAGGDAVVSKLNELGTPLSIKIGPMAYEDVLSMFEAQVVNGRHHELQTRWVAELTEDTAALLLEGARAITSSFSAIAVHHFHGAATRVPVTETAFGLRRHHLLVEIIAAWEHSSADDGTIHRQWARALCQSMAPLALPGGYPNLLGATEHERVRLAYGPNFARLMELKRRFDPENVFASATPTLLGR